MKKKFFICTIMCMSSLAAFSQIKPVAIGINYDKIADAGRDWKFDQGINADYHTKRERIVLELFYGSSSKLNMKSAIGVSAYNSELAIGRPASQSFYKTGLTQISNLYLVLSQTALYDIVEFPNSSSFVIKISPFVTIDYEHAIENTKKKEHGFSDLSSSEANQWISEYGLPAVSAETKIPAGIFSLEGGLSFEAVLFKKVGVNYSFGYSHALFGHSQMDAKFKYSGNDIQTLNLNSKDSGILQKIGIRYYF